MFVIGYHQNESSQQHTQNLTIEQQNSYLYHVYLQIVNLSPPLTSLPLTLQNQNNDRLRDHNQNKC